MSSLFDFMVTSNSPAPPAPPTRATSWISISSHRLTDSRHHMIRGTEVPDSDATLPGNPESELTRNVFGAALTVTSGMVVA